MFSNFIKGLLSLFPIVLEFFSISTFKEHVIFSLSMFVSIFYLLSLLISLSPVPGTAIKDAKYDEERNYALLKHNYVSIKT